MIKWCEWQIRILLCLGEVNVNYWKETVGWQFLIYLTYSIGYKKTP